MESPLLVSIRTVCFPIVTTSIRKEISCICYGSYVCKRASTECLKANSGGGGGNDLVLDLGWEDYVFKTSLKFSKRLFLESQGGLVGW